MDGNVKLVSMAHTSNLDGCTIPAKEVIKIAHENGALVILDGAQSTPHKKVDMKDLDVDFFAFSLHKMCGPTGMGVLYGKYDLLKDMEPLIVGGTTVKSTTYDEFNFVNPPQRFEAGLQNYAGIIGAGAAIEYLKKVGMDNIEEHEHRLNDLAHDIALILDEVRNIMIRSGAHCVHSWFTAHGLKGSARATFYLYNTEEEVKIFAEEVKKIIETFGG
jgi:cysteine desulfurase/selenocysteine lyase